MNPSLIAALMMLAFKKRKEAVDCEDYPPLTGKDYLVLLAIYGILFSVVALIYFIFIR